MTHMLKAYTRALKRYDLDLFAGLTMDGLPCVFRKAKRFEYVCEFEGTPLFNLVTGKQYIFAITDNWSTSGQTRWWGIDDVLNKIRQSDALANKLLFEEMDAANERVDESKKRHIRGEIEGFWSHERRRFAKATDDILTHSLSKDEPRKRLKEKRENRRIKNGNY